MLDRFIRASLQLAGWLRRPLSIIFLRQAVNHAKIRDYDSLVERTQGLRCALTTQQRAYDAILELLNERDAQLVRLRQEYMAFEERMTHIESATRQGEHLAMFMRLQSILTQLPTIKAEISDGADVSAKDVLELLRPLDNLLTDYGFEMIGQAEAECRYNPNHHRVVDQGTHLIVPDDPVRVRYVGFTHNGDVICKAEVIRIPPNR